MNWDTIAAKSVGIRVNEFSWVWGLFASLGRGETNIRCGLLPAGGFVGMEGEDEESNDPRAFNRKSPLQRGLFWYPVLS